MPLIDSLKDLPFTEKKELLPWVQNSSFLLWVMEMAALCQPKNIHFCDGSEEEYQLLCQGLVDGGAFVRLNPEKRPGSFWCHSDVTDVARVEECTFICS